MPAGARAGAGAEESSGSAWSSSSSVCVGAASAAPPGETARGWVCVCVRIVVMVYDTGISHHSDVKILGTLAICRMPSHT